MLCIQSKTKIDYIKDNTGKSNLPETLSTLLTIIIPPEPWRSTSTEVHSLSCKG